MKELIRDLNVLREVLDSQKQNLQSIITYLNTTPNNPKDCYGINNVNFSIVTPEDNNWDEYTQQRINRGFDDSELWNLDITIIKFILPRLKAFKDYTKSIPYSLKSEIEWKDILNRIILGFELYLESDIADLNDSESKIDEAFKLFFKYFKSLWI